MHRTVLCTHRDDAVTLHQAHHGHSLLVLLFFSSPSPLSHQLYLGGHAEHLERGGHVEVLWDADVAEIDPEGLAPNAQPVDIENREITREGEDQSLGIVAPQWVLFPILVRHFDTDLVRFGARAHPEEGVYWPAQTLSMWNTLEDPRNFEPYLEQLHRR